MYIRLRLLLVAPILAAFVSSGIGAVCGQDLKQIDNTFELDTSHSEMRAFIERYQVDRSSLLRSLPQVESANRAGRLRQLYNEWDVRLQKMDFNRMGQDGRLDYLLMRNHLDHEQRESHLVWKARDEVLAFVPFERVIVDLEETRRRMEPIDPAKTAEVVNNLSKQIAEARKQAESRTDTSKHVANRAAETVNGLRETLRRWFGFYNGYDPLFSWWVSEPYKQADQALQVYAAFLREKLAGIKPGDQTAIVGNPIGREALLSELAHEMIAYTPEELIEIANREFAWCEAEMLKAAREMGHGDDWKKALEQVKNAYVEPGKQPHVIRNLAVEAIQFLDANQLVTIPPLVRETWRMEMMSPERQLVSPFFLGGETILVSYPTSTMSHEQKMMSMRGNNPHFSRATVHHELIPGHHLQGFMRARYRTHRRIFDTPFLTEGWAFYWEMLLWDMGFAKTPPDRIGFLFWRMHRCARIIFSLNVHLGKMTPQECIDFLVDRVGHERDNATAEVRRSFAGAYGPLYQCAYMLGGLQVYSLHRELVKSGKMTNRAFHDAVLKENSIPVAMIRASLTRQPLTSNHKPSWRFYGDATRP